MLSVTHEQTGFHRHHHRIALGLALVGFLLFRFAGKDAPPVVVNLTPGPPQPRVSPEEAGMDPQALEAAVAYAGARDTRALLVGRGGHVVFEKYWDGTSADTRGRSRVSRRCYWRWRSARR